MDEEFDVVVTGFDVERRRAEASLMHVFGLESHNARRFVRELPLVAQRRVSRSLAEPYVTALRAIGARVELRPAELEANALGQTSLPAPSQSALVSLRESFQVDRAADSAIARFRAAEGLDSVERSEDGLDLFNPEIPKAPPLPHDLARMPNAALPNFTDPPGRLGSLSLDSGASDNAKGFELRPAHANAQLPPAAAAAATREGSTPRVQQSAQAPSLKPGAIGLARAAAVSGRLGLGSLSAWPRPGTGTKRRSRARWFAAAGLALVVFAGLRFWGVPGHAEQRRLDAWRREGIEPGKYAVAAQWLVEPQHELPGLSKEAALQLPEQLGRAGALAAYVIRIRPTDRGELGGGLLIELPDGPAAARRAILQQAAKMLGHAVPESDRGQRFAVLACP